MNEFPRILAAALGLLPLFLSADMIYLKNGDRLTGTIASGPDGNYVVTTAYGGVLSISTSLVDRVEEGDGASREAASGEKVLAAVTAAPAEPLPRNWDANVDLSSTISRGNTDSHTFNLQGGYRLKREQHRYAVDVSSIREEKGGDTTKEQDKLDLGYKYLFAPKWFFGTNVLYERDPIALLDRRISVNPGVGYIVWEEEGRSLNFQLGAGYADEQVDGVDESTAFVEWRLDYEQDLLDGGMEFFHRHQVYRNMSGRRNAVFSSQTGFRYDIMDGIYLNLQANYDYDTEPADGAEEDDLVVLVGAGVNF